MIESFNSVKVAVFQQGESIKLLLNPNIPIGSFSNILLDFFEPNSGHYIAQLALNPENGYTTTSLKIDPTDPNKLWVGIDYDKTKDAKLNTPYYLKLRTVVPDDLFDKDVYAEISCSPIFIFREICK